MTITRCYRLLVTVLLQACALILVANPAQAQEQTPPTHISAELVVHSAASPGGEAMLAIHMKPAPGWHGYWSNPGDAGFGMELDWTLPKGAKTGRLRYPVPQTLLISKLMNHVYKGDYAVLVPLTLPADAAPGTRLPVLVDAQWLACTDEVCVPEQGTLQASVEVWPKGPEPGAPPRDGRFDKWTSRLPAPLGATARFQVAGDTIRIAIPLPESMVLEDPHIFPVDDRVIAYAAPQTFTRLGDLLIAELQRPGRSPADPEQLSALLRLNDAGDGLSFTAEPGAVASGGIPIKSPSAAMAASLPLLLLGALLGGLLLNIMPCVFPILSLKALSLARAGESDAKARTEGIAYMGGVIAATMALGALLLALRAAGEQIGWAFQLQEPAVVTLLLLLAAAITANFMGLFEFAVPGIASEGSPQSAFATGLLASIVATPCTGPFMAAAMGAALLLPVAQALALFFTLGLGLALPFLAIAFIPALRKSLPKPGPWMNGFRRWMALPMGLTALALLWLASRVGGMNYAFVAAVLALALMLTLYLAGRLQKASKSAYTPLAIGLTAIAVAGLTWLPASMSAPSATSQSLLAARPFSEAALAGARASGKPVFAWFTADWCITCKVNEQVAIEREETRAAFEKAGVTVLRGDWTRRDPAITRYLTAQGAAGVPLYVWYPAGGGPQQQLPQVLTQGALVELAKQ